MPQQLTILGLGQIGASFGLALGRHPNELIRVGHDREIGNARKAEKKGAVDRISLNLPASVENADLILLALPQDQIRETMQIIGSDLRPGTVVLDTAPSKAAVVAVMQEFLPKTCSYVGLLPIIGPLYLHGIHTGVESAQSDFFAKSLVGIIAPKGTSPVALQSAVSLVERVGSDKMFMDQAEADSYMASLYILPDLLAAALVATTTGRGGWQEGRKLAGRPYAMATAHLAAETSVALAQSAISSQEHTLRHLKNMIAALEDYARLVAANDVEAMSASIQEAQTSYQQWRQERDLGGWMAEELSPSTQAAPTSDWFSRLLGLQPRQPKRK
jgi:prephenate dehydrogenase